MPSVRTGHMPNPIVHIRVGVVHFIPYTVRAIQVFCGAYKQTGKSETGREGVDSAYCIRMRTPSIGYDDNDDLVYSTVWIFGVFLVQLSCYCAGFRHDHDVCERVRVLCTFAD